MGTIQKILTTTLWGLLVLIMLSVVGAGLWRENRDRQAARATDTTAGSPAVLGETTGPGPLMFEVPPFALVDQNGHPVTRESLLGHPWVAAFIFTNCTQACPMMSMKLAKLQDALAGTDVKLVSFTVDPDRDTPEVLKRYAERYEGDSSRWLLLTGDKGAIYDVAAGMKIGVQPPTTAGGEITHSDRFVLIDAGAMVRDTYLSSDDDALARLQEDARDLAAAAAPAPAAPLRPAAPQAVPTH
jgi:protein SCO1